jgi:hypothetical protein
MKLPSLRWIREHTAENYHMTRDELLTRLARLRQACVGQVRVPHKPLLLLRLFGQFAATGSSAVSYQQAEEPVSQLINDCGPPIASASGPGNVEGLRRLGDAKFAVAPGLGRALHGAVQRSGQHEVDQRGHGQADEPRDVGTVEEPGGRAGVMSAAEIGQDHERDLRREAHGIGG